MIGKNGISKMVLREALPIINGRISQMLDGVCDFDIEVLINNKNEITFNIIQDGVVSDVNSGSGFEKTVTALVLRSVISEISTIPKMNFIIFDEILGRVASENHDKIKLLYDRSVKYYDFVFHITHNESVLDWHNQIVTVVRKENGCSELKEVKNTEIKKKNNRIK
jgi:DNA repair exonuclease SbcCD ATPase subunit